MALSLYFASTEMLRSVRWCSCCEGPFFTYFKSELVFATLAYFTECPFTSRSAPPTIAPTATPSSGPLPTPQAGSIDEMTRYCVGLRWSNLYEFHKSVHDCENNHNPHCHPVQWTPSQHHKGGVNRRDDEILRSFVMVKFLWISQKRSWLCK